MLAIADSAHPESWTRGALEYASTVHDPSNPSQPRPGRNRRDTSPLFPVKEWTDSPPATNGIAL